VVSTRASAEKFPGGWANGKEDQKMAKEDQNLAKKTAK